MILKDMVKEIKIIDKQESKLEFEVLAAVLAVLDGEAAVERVGEVALLVLLRVRLLVGGLVLDAAQDVVQQAVVPANHLQLLKRLLRVHAVHLRLLHPPLALLPQPLLLLQVLHVLHPDLRRQSLRKYYSLYHPYLDDPRVAQRVDRLQPLARLPRQALLQEVDELLVRRVQHRLQVPRPQTPPLPELVVERLQLVLLTKKVLPSRQLPDVLRLRSPDDLADQRHLVLLVLSRE